MSWTIIPLTTGILRDRPKDSITYGVGAGETVDLFCFSWLLLGDEGPIVVDTGPSTAEYAAAVHRVRLEKGPAHDLSAALAAHGVAVEDVRRVVLTHLHWDHCHGCASLPHARLLVQDSELRYAREPEAKDRRVYEHGSDGPLLEQLPRMETVDGRAEVASGVTVLPTPGHSPGHQSVLVEAASRRYLIAGDHFDLYENLSERIPSGPTVDVDTWERSCREVARLGVEVLPGHDGSVLRRKAYR